VMSQTPMLFHAAAPRDSNDLDAAYSVFHNYLQDGRRYAEERAAAACCPPNTTPANFLAGLPASLSQLPGQDLLRTLTWLVGEIGRALPTAPAPTRPAVPGRYPPTNYVPGRPPVPSRPPAGPAQTSPHPGSAATPVAIPRVADTGAATAAPIARPEPLALDPTTRRDGNTRIFDPVGPGRPVRPTNMP
jgi:hypothetical protein